MKRVITIILDKSWDGATVEVIGADGNIAEEYNGVDAGHALMQFGEAIDDANKGE